MVAGRKVADITFLRVKPGCWEIVQELNANTIFKMVDVKRRFVDQGSNPVGGMPSQFADHIRAEIQKWAEVVKDANIQPE
jgi:tripartite-type tricarboxylate transporter receptor subunit TctC